ncbi:sulfotransferase family 2 domain-containing protein [Acuticoccus sp. MNP-M23]|uniref:sulfotransferase family 2 domain-containing protein n=1 Tax=Acuticoccus sp. MNP-M23 TaxID=3072793 RepID=UPI0028153BB3|nr:sulfotransferase family 2 domain-containing protein [Acuticoccus sp. MNP-M23]WMS43580.1 sulfotransferase family 2 domain-containing protein [Acuticoccus sp. MNP-M23]
MSTIPVIIHLHVPKCAGTSIKFSLKERIGLRMLSAEHSDEMARFEAMPASERDAAYDCVAGHIVWGMHEKFTRPVIYISVVRDPLERLCSFFNYVHLQPGHPAHERIANTLPDINAINPHWIERTPGFRAQFTNLICRHFAGKEVTEAGYDALETRLLDDMSAGRFVTGTLDVVETWLSENDVVIPGKTLPHVNRSSDYKADHPFVKASPEMLTPRTRRLLLRLNALDYKLIETISWANFVAGRGPRPEEGWRQAQAARAKAAEGETAAREPGRPKTTAA